MQNSEWIKSDRVCVFVIATQQSFFFQKKKWILLNLAKSHSVLISIICIGRECLNVVDIIEEKKTKTNQKRTSNME